MRAFYFTLITTFFVGFISGSYVYFVTEDELPQFFAGTDVPDYEIIGDTYGGCQRLGECPSFLIQDSGTYTHLSPKRGEEPERTTRQLTRDTREDIRDLLRSTDFERIENSTFSGTCPIAYDGLAFRYEIHIGEVRYRLDTCRQEVEGELFEYLTQYFETP